MAGRVDIFSERAMRKYPMAKIKRKRYSPKFKFQVVLELLQSDKTPGQVAKAYGIHPNTAGKWRQQFLEKGAEVFAQEGTIAEYERTFA